GYGSGGLLAPGAFALKDHRGEHATTVHGTSFATAIVSGAAGLLMSLALKHGRHPHDLRVSEILLDSAEKCFDDSISCRRCLAGRLDLGKAARLVRARPLQMDDEGTLPISSPHRSEPLTTPTTEPASVSGRQGVTARRSSDPLVHVPVHSSVS